MPSGRWADKAPPLRAWKGPAGLPRAVRSAEQDKASGGRIRRTVDVGDGVTACASIELKVLPNTRRIRAYLRWSFKGKTVEKYVGEVSETTRTRNLEAAWRLVFDQRLVIVSEKPAGSWASSPSVRSVMKANRARDTKPELALRSAVHKLGLRYRVDVAPLKGLRRRADLVFTHAKVAVFSDGCYWHGCPEHHRPSHKNSNFWKEKISGNKDRDRDTDAQLADHGWLAVRVWEHEEVEAAANRIARVVRDRAGR
ncbi:very short patch repair endonuclease [Actinoplanes lutulentus]|nr:very short patch repair endonuclease [Actinoplanes lutulentus]